MNYDIKKYTRLKKAELLKDHPLYWEEKEFEAPEEPLACTHLYLGDMIEIGMVVSGSGIHRILSQEIPCKAGDIYIINTDIPHGYFAAETGEPLLVRRLLFDIRDWFDGNVSTPGDPHFCYGVFRDSAVTAYAMLTAQKQEEIGRHFDTVIREASEKKDEWRNAIRSHLALLLITVGRYINGAIKSIPEAPEKEWSTVSSVMRIVLDSFEDSELTLGSIADQMFVSASRLSRMFKDLTGNSFSDYLRAVRLGHACTLLKDTELTVEEIVRACGLKDIPSFYRAFSAQTDMTPNQYRTEQKNKSITQTKGKRFMIILSDISAHLQAGKAKLVKEMVQQAIDEGIPAETILKEGLVPGMNAIGEKFKNNEIFVPEVLVAARAMNQGASLLKPLLVQEGAPSVGKVCIGTVHGDLHDIGKNIVKMMLEGKGFEVIDLGTDVPAKTFVDTAIEQNCRIICCSALLTTTMGVMADVVKEAEAAGIRDKVKIMVGGAPVSESFCRQIGADAYTSDAASCADLALEFCKE